MKDTDVSLKQQNSELSKKWVGHTDSNAVQISTYNLT